MTALELPRPLITPEALVSALDDPRVRPVDVRWKLGIDGYGRSAYEAGHIPGAVFVDLDRDLAAPPGDGRHPLPDPESFARRMGELGIGPDTFVVAYDDTGGTVAARLWWMLDQLGHAGVAVLDGGIEAWRTAGLPVSTESPTVEPASLPLRGAWTGIVGRDELAARLRGGTGATLIDARAPERYRGEVEPVDPVAGHIPGARNAPTGGNLDVNGRFRDPAELRARYLELAGGSNRVIVSCGSGVNACHSALAMRLAGLPDALLYPGSYSDWSRHGMQVTTGPEPGALREVESNAP